MKIYIVRHGEVLQNVLKQYSLEDEDLNNRGIAQAKELKNKLKDVQFDLIISSPLVRAKSTANILNTNNEIVIDERIKERDCGDLTGKSFQEINREEYWNYNTKIQYGTSENIKEFFKRVYNFLDELKTKNYNNVLIVTHSGVSKACSAYFEGIKDGKFLNRGLKNGEVKIYDYK